MGLMKMGPFLYLQESISIKKGLAKQVLFLCVNQTKLIALSLLSFLFNGFPSCSTYNRIRNQPEKTLTKPHCKDG
jgi:hypothetical protein